MSFLDHWFGSKKNDNLIDMDKLTKQYQQYQNANPNHSNKSTNTSYFEVGNPLEKVTKRFHPGKGSQRVDPAYTEIGTDSNNKANPQRNMINREYFIRKKDRLRGFSTDLLVQAIIRTRTNQVLQYAMPVSRSDDGNGFRVIKKGKSLNDMTTHEKNVARKLEKFIYYTGKNELDWRDDFPTFLAKIIHDFYVYDQINIERIFESAKSNQLNHFNYIDANTVLIDEYPKSIDKPKSYVQIINRKKVAHFDSKHLTFITYWAQNMDKNSGYGFSPVEAGIPQITYHINVEQFNARFFSQGGMTRGLLLIDPGESTGTSRVSLDSLRRNLMPTQGINGSWKIPIVQAHDAKYVNMTQSSKDMEFVNFLNYLNNIICADFQIQPDEVNFPNRGGANGRTGGSTLNEGNTTRTKMNASKQNGLAPLLKFIERIMTDKILRYVDDRYRFVFTPSDEQREQLQQQELSLKLRNGETLNEARAEQSLPPLDLPNIPGDATTLIQYLNIQAKNDPVTNVQQQHSNDYKPGHNDAQQPNGNNPNGQDQNNQNNQNSQDNQDQNSANNNESNNPANDNNQNDNSQ